MSNGWWHRLRRAADLTWRGIETLADVAIELLGVGQADELHTVVTYRAVVDAVVPRTPELGDELGPEHVPGGLAIDLEDFVVTYVDGEFQFGLPHLGPRGNIPLAEPIADVLDAAAQALLDDGENDDDPTVDRATSLLGRDEGTPRRVRRAAGAFAKLSRRDRLRAIGRLDDLEFRLSTGPGDLFEFDAGLVGQLVVGFAELIYYSEWQGYDEFVRPPSERRHPNDPAAVQSWRQTGYPGFADGYAALRGYLGTDDGPLGGGDVWATVDDEAAAPVRITLESGAFRENEYDTSGYEEPFPE